MPPEYKVISAHSAEGLEKALGNAKDDHWKPILLTSAYAGDNLLIAAILERTTVA